MNQIHLHKKNEGIAIEFCILKLEKNLFLKCLFFKIF